MKAPLEGKVEIGCHDSIAWRSLSIEDVMTLLVARADGLSTAEALRRRATLRHVHSTVPVLQDSVLARLVMPLFLAALAAGVWIGNLWILLFGPAMLVAILTSLAVRQAVHARKIRRRLQQFTEKQARVLRDGFDVSIPSEELVPGDIMILRAGSIVPADGRILESTDLECDEKALFGVSTPRKKNGAGQPNETAEASGMVFQGALITQGKALAVATETGASTCLGRKLASYHRDFPSVDK